MFALCGTAQERRFDSKSSICERDLNFCYYLLLFSFTDFTKLTGFSIIFLKFADMRRRTLYGACFLPLKGAFLCDSGNGWQR